MFGGLGSTLIAAEQTGRKAFLMEIDPLYADVIVQRSEKFTRKKAERLECRASHSSDASLAQTEVAPKPQTTRIP